MVDEMSEYEVRRRERMERNKEAMKNLGLHDLKQELKRKREEERQIRQVERKKKTQEGQEEFVPRRTTRQRKEIEYIQIEWKDSNAKKRQRKEELKLLFKSSNSKEKEPCLICGLKVFRNHMRHHIGAHIIDENFNKIRCGFCGTEGSSCGHKQVAGINYIVPIGDPCPMFHKVSLATVSNNRCTNVPLRCIKCSKWLWKYTMATHLQEEHDGMRRLPKEYRETIKITKEEVDVMQKEMESIRQTLNFGQEDSDFDSGEETDDNLRVKFKRSYSFRNRKPIITIDSTGESSSLESANDDEDESFSDDLSD